MLYSERKQKIKCHDNSLLSLLLAGFVLKDLIKLAQFSIKDIVKMAEYQFSGL
jgi:hypothetical protein